MKGECKECGHVFEFNNDDLDYGVCCPICFSKDFECVDEFVEADVFEPGDYEYTGAEVDGEFIKPDGTSW